MRRLLLVIAAVLLAGLTPRAMQAMLDATAIQDALTIGQSRLAIERTQFQQPYRVTVGVAPIDYVEVVTPFRRVELAAEGRTQAGDRSFGQRQALELLAATPGQLEIQVELTFHPLNTYVGVPDYSVVLLRSNDTRPLEPLTMDRIPRYGPRVDGLPLPSPTAGAGIIRNGRSQPILGGTVIARFDARALDPNGTVDMVMREKDSEVGRASLDLSRMR